MSINLDTGLWQCFKSDNSGNFIGLYAKLENKTYQSACTELLFENNIDKDPEPVPRKPVQEVGVDAHDILMSETGCIPISANSLCEENYFLQIAWEYIYKRKLFNLTQDPEDVQFYLGTDGSWKNRLIIPFVDENKKIFFFQGRTLDGAHPKYLSCEGIKASNILYPFQSGQPYVVVCEGPIDVLSLNRQGINATCTMTNKPSEIQIKQLAEVASYSQMKIVVGYDNDEAGQKGLQKFEELRKKFLLDKIYVAHPPDEYKDWGEMHENSIDIKLYIENNMSKLDFPYIVGTSLSKL